MSTNSQSISAIRIVSLPYELDNANKVADFVKSSLGFPDAVWVNIVNMKTDSGVSYRSAFVDIADSVANIDSIYPSNGLFHFDNGMPMDHIKIVACKKNAPSIEPLVLEDGEWSSIYLPAIPADLTIDNGDLQFNDQPSMSEFFEDLLKIGQISRIDFVDKKQSGRGAFVHFDHWYNNRSAIQLRKTIATRGQFVCKGYYDGFEFCNFDNNRYLVLKMDTKGEVSTKNEQSDLDVANARIVELEKQNAELKKVAQVMIRVPNIGVNLDVGPILAENSRLREQLADLTDRVRV
jgi:hypothetical protein